MRNLHIDTGDFDKSLLPPITPKQESGKCNHTPCPDGYMQWHSWASESSRTHRQIKCENCDLWAVWTPIGVLRQTA